MPRFTSPALHTSLSASAQAVEAQPPCVVLSHRLPPQHACLPVPERSRPPAPQPSSCPLTLTGRLLCPTYTCSTYLIISSHSMSGWIIGPILQMGKQPWLSSLRAHALRFSKGSLLPAPLGISSSCPSLVNLMPLPPEAFPSWPGTVNFPSLALTQHASTLLCFEHPFGDAAELLINYSPTQWDWGKYRGWKSTEGTQKPGWDPGEIRGGLFGEMI